MREIGKAKVGVADKVSTVAPAARADTKGKGTPDHLGKLLQLHENKLLRITYIHKKNR